MFTLDRIEKVLFLLLLFSIPFQTRVFLWSADVVGGFNEWQSVFLYATDVLIVALFFLWAWRLADSFFSEPRFSFSSENRPLPLAPTPPPTTGSQAVGAPRASSKKGQLGTPVLLAIFLVVGFISIFFASHGGVGVYRWVKLVEFVALFFYGGHIIRRLNLSHVALVFIASGLVQSFIVIGQFSLQRSLGLKLLGESVLRVGDPAVAHIITSSGWYIRAYGTFPSPNVLAAFLSIAILFLLYWYISRRPNQFFLFGIAVRFFQPAASHPDAPANDRESSRRDSGSFLKERLARPVLPALLIDGFMLVSLILLIFALFLTFSRGVLLAFFVSSALFFGLLLFSQRRRATLRVLGFFIAAHVLVVGLMWPELFSRFGVSNPTNDAAVTERFFFNEVAYQAITIQPWVGVGLGNFTFFYRDFFSGLSEHLYQPVHNIFLFVGAEMGLIALILFIVFFAKMFGAHIAHFLARDSKQSEQALFIAIFTFILLSGFIDHYYLTLQQGSLIFWIVLGMGYYYSKARKLNS